MLCILLGGCKNWSKFVQLILQLTRVTASCITDTGVYFILLWLQCVCSVVYFITDLMCCVHKLWLESVFISHVCTSWVKCWKSREALYSALPLEAKENTACTNWLPELSNLSDVFFAAAAGSWSHYWQPISRCALSAASQRHFTLQDGAALLAWSV